MIPTTMRKSFSEDPFFKDTWDELEKSQKNFFESSRKQFEESVKRMESAMKDFSRDILRFEDQFPRMSPKMSLLDADELKVLEAGDKVELSLDTAGYKPDELKVTAGRGIICVEGKHEEKTEAGQVMVSRQFSRQYGLPANSKAEEVVSNLSQDGVLLVTVPKHKAVGQERRQVPIETKQ